MDSQIEMQNELRRIAACMNIKFEEAAEHVVRNFFNYDFMGRDKYFIRFCEQVLKIYGKDSQAESL